MAFNAKWSIPIFESKGFPKKSEILSFHWGVSQSRNAWESDRTGSSGQVRDFSVVRRIDAQSPILFTACAYGDKIPTMFVYLESINGTTILTYATYTFEGCFIASMRPGGGGGDEFPLEEVSVNFEKVKYEYKKN